MSKVKKWYNWPSGYIGDLIPWYNIVRRCLVIPFIVTLGGINYVLVFLGYGKRYADESWRGFFG